MPQVGYATAVPTLTTQFYSAGDMLINSAPGLGQPYGWVCIVSGYPGTWGIIGVSPAGNALTSTLALGAYPNGNRLILANPGAATSNTLPVAASHAATFATTIKNISANSLTLTPATGETYQDAAAITLAQNAAITLLAGGTTIWYKQA